MSKKRKFSVIGVTLVTPALTAGAASASVPRANAEQNTMPGDATLAASRMKTEMLSITPNDKLRIAGDRVPMMLGDELSNTKDGGYLKVAGKSTVAGCNVKDPVHSIDCKADQTKVISTVKHPGIVMRTNTDIRECWGTKECNPAELKVNVNQLCAINKEDLIRARRANKVKGGTIATYACTAAAGCISQTQANGAKC